MSLVNIPTATRPHDTLPMHTATLPYRRLPLVHGLTALFNSGRPQAAPTLAMPDAG